jgi:hypothetical protein
MLACFIIPAILTDFYRTRRLHWQATRIYRLSSFLTHVCSNSPLLHQPSNRWSLSASCSGRSCRPLSLKKGNGIFGLTAGDYSGSDLPTYSPCALSVVRPTYVIFTLRYQSVCSRIRPNRQHRYRYICQQILQIINVFAM